MESFAERLTESLRIRNMKQAELSKRTGIPKSAINQYCSGAFKPKQQRLIVIAKALDVGEAWLMGLDAPMERGRLIAVIDQHVEKESQQSEVNEAPNGLLPIPQKISNNCSRPSVEEGYTHILRGLISYHRRMTMGDIPQKDFYLDALKFALACVEEKIPK